MTLHARAFFYLTLLILSIEAVVSARGWDRDVSEEEIFYSCAPSVFANVVMPFKGAKSQPVFLRFESFLSLVPFEVHGFLVSKAGGKVEKIGLEKFGNFFSRYLVEDSLNQGARQVEKDSEAALKHAMGLGINDTIFLPQNGDLGFAAKNLAAVFKDSWYVRVHCEKLSILTTLKNQR